MSLKLFFSNGTYTESFDLEIFTK